MYCKLYYHRRRPALSRTKLGLLRVQWFVLMGRSFCGGYVGDRRFPLYAWMVLFLVSFVAITWSSTMCLNE
jgi:hypothetical protein